MLVSLRSSRFGRRRIRRRPNRTATFLRGRSKISVLVFLLPPLLLYLATVGFPIAQAVFLSFFRWDGITNMQFIGLENYRRMLAHDPTFWRAASHSVVYLGVGLIIQVGGALLVANALTYLRRGRDTLKTLYLLPAVLSTVAIALLFRRIYSTQPRGLVNQVLSGVGLDSLARPWLSNIHTALVAVSIPEGWRFMGLYTIILFAGLLTVPPEVEEAAASTARPSGASSSRSGCRICGRCGSRRWSWRPPTGCAASTCPTC
jgi:raffinose/stachyose/melibiose transport system permease protein